MQLSKKKLDGLKVWDDMTAWAARTRPLLEGTITEENKGGLVANVKGIRVFIPASQSGIRQGRRYGRHGGQDRADEDHRGQPCPPQSHRLHPRRQQPKPARLRMEKIWNEIEVGKKYHGVVKSLTVLRRICGHRRRGRHGPCDRAELGAGSRLLQMW